MKRISVFLFLVTAIFAQTPGLVAEYALVLEDPPVAQKAQSRIALQSAEAQAHMKKVRHAQSLVLAELAARKVRVAATSQILVNAVFVHVTPKDAAALKNIPGVKWVQYQPPSKPARQGFPAESGCAAAERGDCHSGGLSRCPPPRRVRRRAYRKTG